MSTQVHLLPIVFGLLLLRRLITAFTWGAVCIVSFFQVFRLELIKTFRFMFYKMTLTPLTSKFDTETNYHHIDFRKCLEISCIFSKILNLIDVLFIQECFSIFYLNLIWKFIENVFPAFFVLYFWYNSVQSDNFKLIIECLLINSQHFSNVHLL